MARATHVAIVVFFIFSNCQLAFAEERLALLIGNTEYTEKVGPLVNPRNDIKLMDKALTGLKFSVRSIQNAGYMAIVQAVREHARAVQLAGPGTISLIYYSGHGASDSSTGMNYLIPVDVADADEDSLWIKSVDLKVDVIERLEKTAPEAIHFVIFDACRTELQLRKKGKKLLTVDGKTFTPLQPTGPVLVAYSTAVGRPASDNGAGGGPYAHALSEQIIVPGVEAVSMFRAVQLRVQKSIGQQPYLSVPALAEFFFAGKDQPTPANVFSGPQNTIATSGEEEKALEAERVSSRRAMNELLLQLTNAGQKPGGVFVSGKNWPAGSLLKFCFLDGEVKNQRHIANIANQWTLYGNIRFDFGSVHLPRRCEEDDRESLAITMNGPGNWAYIGTDAKKVVRNPVISIESVKGLTEEQISRGVAQVDILHEFGHILGFVHAWSFPNCDKELNWPVITKSFRSQYKWTDEQIKSTFQASDSGVIRGVFDKNSVMGYTLPSNFFIKGAESSCFMAPPGQLSMLDKLAVSTAYP